MEPDAFVQLLSVLIAAVLGAGLNHVFARRSVSVEALRKERTAFAVAAAKHRRDVTNALVEGGDAGGFSLSPAPTLVALDPIGSGLVWGMVSDHLEAIQRVMSEWGGVRGPELVFVPPALVDEDERLSKVIALWAQASWRMPLLRLRWRRRLHWRRVGSIAYDNHGSRNRRIQRAEAADMNRSYRSFKKKIKSERAQATRWVLALMRQKRRDKDRVRCDECGAWARKWSEGERVSNLSDPAAGEGLGFVVYRCDEGHMIERTWLLTEDPR